MLLLLFSLWSLDLDNDCGSKIQRLPEIRHGIMQTDLVLDERYILAGDGRELAGVWVFLGIDPGDKIEFAASVYADSTPVALRSEHKPWSADYDAWRWYPNYVKHVGPVDEIAVDVSANVVGENHITPRAEGVKTARPHFGVWLVWKCR